MPNLGRTLLLAAVLACGLIAVPTASAAKRVTVDVRPDAPRLGTPIKVTVSAPEPTFGTPHPLPLPPSPASTAVCVPDKEPVEMRELSGGRFTATLRPRLPSAQGDMPRPKVWCPGPATLRLEVYGPGTLRTPLAKWKIRFTRGPREAEPPPIPAHEVAVTVLPGSTLTAWAPGRPDRSTPVTGTLLGRYKSGEQDGRTLVTNQIAGTLALPSLAPDPLCPGSTPPTSVEVDSASGLVNRADAGDWLTLVLRTTPAELFGCATPGGPAGTTTLTSAGALPGLYNRRSMIGVVGDVALPGGSQGGITANLLVQDQWTNRWVP